MNEHNSLFYLILIISAIGTAGNFALTKKYQKTVGIATHEGVIFNMLIGLFSSILFWFLGGCHMEYTPFSLGMAFLMSLFNGAYTMIGFRIMSIGNMTVYTIFLMLGGAVVPYLYGLIFLSESVSFARIIALLLIISAVILNCYKNNTEKPSGYYILLCISVFLLNGGCSVVSKMHQIENHYAVVSADTFIFLKSVVRFLFFTFLLPFSGKKADHCQRLSLKIYLLFFASAVVSSIAYLLQLIGASHLPATVLYPIVTGGTIVTASFFDRLCFGQHISKLVMASIIICIIALALFML